MAVKGELVFIPLPAIGHLTSIVELAKHLVLLNSDLSITILLSKPLFDTELTAYANSFTSDDQTETTRIKFIDLPPPQFGKLDDLDPFKFTDILVQTVWPSVKEAASHIVQNSTSVPGSPRLAGFVLDVFLVPFVDLANELGVPSYVFYTSGAAFLGFTLYIRELHEKHEVNVVELKGSDVEFTIPSYLNSVSSKFFPTLMLYPQFFPWTNDTSRKLKEVKGIMINTFWELESHALSYLRNDDTVPPIYPVGPVLNLNRASKVHDSLDIVKWLDEQPRSSVVFLCFGSMGSFNEDQVKEIACALEQSGHRFLWSLRKPPFPTKGMTYNDISEALPEGFLARTSSIGKIIGWAPQVAILGHPAVGGFVSHCGWNSTLESIWFGVPMATWPLFAEQQLNAFQLVIDLGLAVEIKMDYKKDFLPSDDIVVEIVSAAEIVKGIRCVMEQDSVVRKRVKEMSKKSRKSLMNGGSSHSALHCLINDVNVNIR